MDRTLAGLSTRRYPLGLGPVGQRTEQVAASTSRSAVSRRLIAATQSELQELLAADLSSVDLVAVIVDGVHDVHTPRDAPARPRRDVPPVRVLRPG